MNQANSNVRFFYGIIIVLYSMIIEFFSIFLLGLINYNMIHKILLFFILLGSITLNAQKYQAFQDPADWIPLEKGYNYVATSITPRPGQLPEMYSAPIKFVSVKENDIFGLKLTIEFLKYGFNEDGKELVQLEGSLNLACCKNKPAIIEFQDKEGNAVHFTKTDNEGNFKTTSPNGKLMEFNNYRIKLNFNRIKATDIDLNSKQVVLKWLNKPSEKQLKRLRRKAKRQYEKDKKYIDELRNKND